MVNGELKIKWGEAVVAYFKVLSQHLPKGVIRIQTSDDGNGENS
jgi:hypothetical protein